jgi:tetratricopeptide (TPR) repeat protein
VTVVPLQNSPSLHDVADLALQVSIGIIAIVTLIIGAVAIFGFREAKDIRRLSAQLRNELEESRTTKSALERRLLDFEDDFETLVLAAHLFHEGETAYLVADYNRAISFYEEALIIQPDNGRIHVRLARALINKGLNSRAERSLRIALERDERNSDAWRALATVKRYIDIDEAIKFSQKALEIDGSSVDNWNYHGLLLRDAQRYEEALDAHREAARISPTDGVTCFFLALMLLKIGRADDARHSFYEAHLRAKSLQVTRRIKPMWAKVIEWGYLYSLDERDRELEAVDVAKELSEACTEKRNRQAVLCHMMFFLEIRGIDVRSDLSMSHFPPEDIAYIEQRLSGN